MYCRSNNAGTNENFVDLSIHAETQTLQVNAGSKFAALVKR